MTKAATHMNKKTGQQVAIVSEYENNKGPSVSFVAVKDGAITGPSRGMVRANFLRQYVAL